jgi:hypothetical protein
MRCRGQGQHIGLVGNAAASLAGWAARSPSDGTFYFNDERCVGPMRTSQLEFDLASQWKFKQIRSKSKSPAPKFGHAWLDDDSPTNTEVLNDKPRPGGALQETPTIPASAAITTFRTNAAT